MPQSPEHPIEKQGPEEALEFLKRNEVRTMAKDVASLREEEATKERQKIVSIKPETLIPLPTPLPAPVKEPEPKASSLMPASRRARHFDKVFIRVALILGITFILINITAFAVWNMKKSKEIPPSPLPTPAPTPILQIPPSVPQIPPITEKLVTWGYRIPQTPRTIDTIIILSAASSSGDPYNIDGILQDSKSYRVSPHYLIDRNGIIYRLVSDADIAYYAGAGQMPDGTRKNIINTFALGIELVYAQTDSPNEAQYSSLANLVAYLQNKYAIPSSNILGHKDINSAKTGPWNFDATKLEALLHNL